MIISVVADRRRRAALSPGRPPLMRAVRARCALRWSQNRTVAHRARTALRRGFGQPVRYAVLLAGALPVLAFPAPNLEFLAWVGLVPGLMLMLAAPTRREAGVRGWWFGAGYLLAAMYWLLPNLGPGLLLIAIVLGALWAGVGSPSGYTRG